LLDHNYFNEW